MDDPGHAAMPLTDPDALWVFDGLCNFCSWSVRLAIIMDRGEVLRFTSVQSAYGQALCRRHGIDPAAPATFLFFDRGRAYEASGAIIALLARLQPPWRWFASIAVVPKPLRDAAYFWVARNRYRLFGTRRACMIPDAKVRRRFIDATSHDG